MVVNTLKLLIQMLTTVTFHKLIGMSVWGCGPNVYTSSLSFLGVPNCNVYSNFFALNEFSII